MPRSFLKRIPESIAARLIRPANRLFYRRFSEFPYGTSPRGSAEDYRRLWEGEKAKDYPAIGDYEEEFGAAIDRDWFHDLALRTQVVIKKSDICYQHGRLLYTTLSDYVRLHSDQSINILETGTARGFSSLCMAKALRDAGRPGKILTFDIVPNDVPMYWNCIADVDGPRSRAELLGDYESLIEEFIIYHQGDTRLELGKISLPRIHFAFLDGVHTYEYVVEEFRFVERRQREGDVIFFDDYTPAIFPGIVRGVDEICDVHGYSKRVVTVSDQRGFVVARKGRIPDG